MTGGSVPIYVRSQAGEQGESFASTVLEVEDLLEDGLFCPRCHAAGQSLTRQSHPLRLRRDEVPPQQKKIGTL
jgi:hypothetical protein